MSSQSLNPFSPDREIASTGHHNAELRSVFGPVIAKDDAFVHLGDVVHNHIAEKRITALSFESASFVESKTPDTDFAALTSKFLALVIQVLDLLRACQNHAARQRVVDPSIASLHAPCMTICFKLKAIQRSIHSVGDRSLDEVYESYVLDEYEHVLQTSRLPFSSLKSRLQAIDPSSFPQNAAYRAVLHQFSNDPKVELIGHYLQTRARAIELLSSAFENDRRIVSYFGQNNGEVESVFESLDADAISFHQSIDDSFHTAQEPSQHDDGEEPSERQVFDFDAELAKSPIYRRQYLRNIIRRQEDASSSQLPGHDHIVLSAGQANRFTFMPSTDFFATKDQEVVVEHDRVHDGVSSSNPRNHTTELRDNKALQSLDPENSMGVSDQLENGQSKPQMLTPRLQASKFDDFQDIFSSPDTTQALPNQLLTKTDLGMVPSSGSQVHPSTNHSPLHEMNEHGNMRTAAQRTPSIMSESSSSSESTIHEASSELDTSTPFRSVDIYTQIQRPETTSNQTTHGAPESLDYRGWGALTEATIPANRDTVSTDVEAPDQVIWNDHSYTKPRDSGHSIAETTETSSGALVANQATAGAQIIDAPTDLTPLPPTSKPRGKARFPTLLEVLERRTTKPYGLFEFYIYMRDQARAVDYLDFWLDVDQHMSLCRHYVRELRRSVLSNYDSLGSLQEVHGTSDPPTSNATTISQSIRSFMEQDPSIPGNQGSSDLPDWCSTSPSSSIIGSAVRRADIRASAEKILYTFLLPGSEREIVLPPSLIDGIIHAIEIEGRDDPEIFDQAKDYTFQAMERDAFPGFLNLGRSRYRVFRTTTLGRALVHGLTGPRTR